ncbi:MAG: pullulanase-associated domain-containing protein [Bifidobacterium sp.]|nr:pullulanase-associated domain-containing protein [Bifidobacterium sp.]
MLANHIKTLWDLGIRGFSIPYTKYMDPKDIGAIKTQAAALIGVPTDELYFTQDMDYHIAEADEIQPEKYTPNGRVSEYRYAQELLSAFSGDLPLLETLDQHKLASNQATVFVGTPNSVRGSETLKPQSGAAYELANAFMLAYGYGRPTILSDYYFDDATRTLAPNGTSDKRLSDVDMTSVCSANTDGASAWGDWNCQPYWTSTRGMVAFHNANYGQQSRNWQTPTLNTIGFARGAEGKSDTGFFAINNTHVAHTMTFETSMADGTYCNCNVYATRLANCAAEDRVTVKDGTLTATVKAKSALAMYSGAVYDSSAQDQVQHVVSPKYEDTLDLGRISDRTLTIYAPAGTAVARVTAADGNVYNITLETVPGHEEWVSGSVPASVGVNTGKSKLVLFDGAGNVVHAASGGDGTYAVPEGATMVWPDDGSLRLGLPFATDGNVRTTVTIHAPHAEAVGVVVTPKDGAAVYQAFDKTDDIGKRAVLTLDGDVREVSFRIVGSEPDDGVMPDALAGTREYTATTLANVSGAIEAWVDSAGDLSLASPEGASTDAVATPNDQKNPQQLQVTIHYHRGDGAYQAYDTEADIWDGWDLWEWITGGDGGSMKRFGSHDAFGEIVTYTKVQNEKGVREPWFIVRKGGDAWKAKDPDDNDRALPESVIQVAGCQSGFGSVEVWLVEGDPTIYISACSDLRAIRYTWRRHGGHADDGSQRRRRET